MTAFLRFNDEEERALLDNVPWEGDWPPPEQITVVSLTPDYKTPIGYLDTSSIENFEELKEFWFPKKFVRKTASKLTDAQLSEAPLLARGAEYIPEGETDEQ